MLPQYRISLRSLEKVVGGSHTNSHILWQKDQNVARFSADLLSEALSYRPAQTLICVIACSVWRRGAFVKNPACAANSASLGSMANTRPCASEVVCALASVSHRAYPMKHSRKWSKGN